MFSEIIKRAGIGRKLLTYILLFSSVVTFLGTSLILYSDYNYDIKQIHKTFRQIESSYLQSISSALWVIDEEQVTELLNGILRFPDMQYLEIWQEGELLFSVGQPQQDNIIQQDYLLSYLFKGEERKLGVLKATANLTGLYKLLWSKTTLILCTQAVKTFMVSAFIFFIFYILVGKHLIFMADYARRFNFNHLESPLILKRKPPKNSDELETLAQSINVMRQNLANDIEERRRAEQEIEASKTYLDKILNNIGDPVFVKDDQHRFTLVNDAFCSTLGLPRGEVIGKTLSEDLPPDEMEHFEKIDRQVLTDGQENLCEESLTVKGGKTLSIVTRKTLYVDEKGDKFLIGVIRDITEQKKAEREKAKLESQLQQAQKMEAIGTLAGGIAHDFNNILSAIIGYTEMARDDSPSESSVANDLDNVLEASARAVGLVKQILSFSRQGDTEHILLQPAIIVNKAILMLRPTLPTTIEITQYIDAKTGLIFADPTQIHQILMNLCTNAFHAMEKTGGRLDISLKEIDLRDGDLFHEPDVIAGTFIQISVGDSGFGMTQEVKDKIFDPYFTTKGAGKGTGMGLSIVHGIVKSYGGFITLSSKLGKGTTFNVFLPVVNEEELPDKEATEQIPIGMERILFIDDEDILADMGKTMLERLGYHVTVRQSSLEALEIFQNQPDQFDVVISDQTMPGMTGVDLAQRMLQIRPDIPIILCTGYSSTISEKKAKSFGIREFALKPVQKKDIAMLIRKVLDGNQA